MVGDGGAAAAFRAALPEARVFSRRGEWPPDVADADLVIHATSVRDEVLFELGEGQTLVDLPYPRTATAEAAAANGARVLDGLEVLVAQGAASFELWTGVRHPLPRCARRRLATAVKPPLISQLRSYHIAAVVLVWAAAGHRGFSPWSIVLASAVTVLVSVVVARRCFGSGGELRAVDPSGRSPTIRNRMRIAFNLSA